MTGLTSVTFRHLSPSEIIRLAQKANMDGIEWGGDIHVPAGDKPTAKIVKEQTMHAGLQVFSYGSYYRLSENARWRAALEPVLQSAAALGAPVVRIWAGELGSAQTTPHLREKLLHNLCESCKMAQDYGLSLALEYHRNTLTDTAESTLHLLQQANCKNLSTYWQTNPDLLTEAHIQEITLLLPYISNIHVFNWGKGDIRLPLKSGLENWKKYFSLLNCKARNYIMEFVRNDSAGQFLEDAALLKDITT